MVMVFLVYGIPVIWSWSLTRPATQDNKHSLVQLKHWPCGKQLVIGPIREKTEMLLAQHFPETAESFVLRISL